MMEERADNDDLVALLDEVRLLFHAATLAVERLHAVEAVTAGERAVLELLHRSGSAPVPELARRRGVSRQHIQTLVNALAAAGLVQDEENPHHRRSALIALTDAGATLIRRMLARERRHLSRVDHPITATAARNAIATLAELRTALGGGATGNVGG